MANFETSQFLPPDRWAVQGAEMFVRFPVEYVTLKKGVRDVWLHVPLTGWGESTVVQIRMVESAWDEGVFAQSSRPLIHPRVIASAASPPHLWEDAVKINAVIPKWVTSKINFGLHVQAMHHGYVFPSQPPFLEIIQEPAREGVTVA